MVMFKTFRIGVVAITILYLLIVDLIFSIGMTRTVLNTARILAVDESEAGNAKRKLRRQLIVLVVVIFILDLFGIFLYAVGSTNSDELWAIVVGTIHIFTSLQLLLILQGAVQRAENKGRPERAKKPVTKLSSIQMANSSVNFTGEEDCDSDM